MGNYEFILDSESIETSLETTTDGWLAHVAGKDFHITKLSHHLYKLSSDSRELIVAAAYHDGQYHVDIQGSQFALREQREDDFGATSADHETEKDKAYPPMPGKIVKIMVSVGDKVSEKQTLALVEAMKMENPVQAKGSGTVKAVNFAEGDQVDTEKAIIELDLSG